MVSHDSLIKGATSQFVPLEELSLNFSFVLRLQSVFIFFSLSHPHAVIIENYLFVVFFNLIVILYVAKISQNAATELL